MGLEILKSVIDENNTKDNIVFFHETSQNVFSEYLLFKSTPSSHFSLLCKFFIQRTRQIHVLVFERFSQSNDNIHFATTRYVLPLFHLIKFRPQFCKIPIWTVVCCNNHRIRAIWLWLNQMHAVLGEKLFNFENYTPKELCRHSLPIIVLEKFHQDVIRRSPINKFVKNSFLGIYACTQLDF